MFPIFPIINIATINISLSVFCPIVQLFPPAKFPEVELLLDQRVMYFKASDEHITLEKVYINQCALQSLFVLYIPFDLGIFMLLRLG